MRKKVIGIFLVVAISLLYGCSGSLQNETASSNSQIVESTINTQTTNNNEDTAKNNENDFEGVEIIVADNTNTSLVLEIYHETECQVEYGEDFLLEKWDEKYHAWMPVPFANDNFAFNDIAYLAEKGKVTEWTVNWDYAYGELEKGKYRIVKKFIDYKVNGNNEFHILSAEFECE